MRTLSTATVGTTTSRNATRLSQRRGASRDATLWGEGIRGSVLVLWRLLAMRGADSSVLMWDFVTSGCVLQHCQNSFTTDGAIFIAAEDNHMQRHLNNHLHYIAIYNMVEEILQCACVCLSTTIPRVMHRWERNPLCQNKGKHFCEFWGRQTNLRFIFIGIFRDVYV